MPILLGLMCFSEGLYDTHRTLTFLVFTTVIKMWLHAHGVGGLRTTVFGGSFQMWALLGMRELEKL